MAVRFPLCFYLTNHDAQPAHNIRQIEEIEIK